MCIRDSQCPVWQDHDGVGLLVAEMLNGGRGKCRSTAGTGCRFARRQVLVIIAVISAPPGCRDLCPGVSPVTKKNSSMSNRNPCPELCRSPLSPCWKVACVGLAVLCGTVVAAETTATEDHCEFRPVLRPPVPETRDRTSHRTPVDRFLLSRLENRRGQVAPAADRRSLLRRLT